MLVKGGQVGILKGVFLRVDLRSFMSQPHFWKSVRITFTLPKWGLGSPPGLSKFQSLIVGVKTPCLEAFFISLEIY